MFRPNFDVNATEGDVNEEVEFAIKTPAGPFGFGSAVELDNDQVDDDDDDDDKLAMTILMLPMMMVMTIIVIIITINKYDNSYDPTNYEQLIFAVPVYLYLYF